jgi:60 kDa SS-A/Ro ribonucleoprotein
MSENLSYSMGESFEMSPEIELYALTCASLSQPTYYVNDPNRFIERIRGLIGRVDPLFVGQLAVYIREKMNLRKIPLILTVELAKVHNNDDLIRRLSRRVIQRADEIVTLLDYYVKANELKPKVVEKKGVKRTKTVHSLSNQMKKGIADAFHKFNEYQFGKYNRAVSGIKLRDALFLTHPKPSNGMEKILFDKIASDTLSTPETWETKKSDAGQVGADSKKVWEELILSGKMGYMALLRNLRNFLKDDIDSLLISKVASILSDPENVKKSKQLPFRFLSAWRMLNGDIDYSGWDVMSVKRPDVYNEICTPILLEALENAVDCSLDNIPMFANKSILLATDVSGSMIQNVSEKSSIRLFDIGALFANLVHKRVSDSKVGMFGDTFKILDDLPEGTLQATNELYRREGEVGYSTNGYLVVEHALNEYKKSGITYDSIMIFTDTQLWGRHSINTLWNEYRAYVPNAKLYLFNLSSYGQTPISLKGNGVSLITGWSDSIFKVLQNIENGEDILSEIREISL